MFEATCVKDFYMQSGKVAFKKDKTYTFSFTNHHGCLFVTSKNEIYPSNHYLPKEDFFAYFETTNKSVKVLYG